MKKLFVLVLAICLTLPLVGCKGKTLDIRDYLIEERDNLFVAKDSIYQATLSSGKRELDYDLDGVINDKTDFAILSLSRLDNQPMANDSYSYVVTIGEESYTGSLEKSSIDNAYVVDLGVSVADDSEVHIVVDFTGYTFDSQATNISKDFAYNKSSILDIANQELSGELKELSKDNNIEVVMKLIKDYSSELDNYFYYIGVVSTNGEVLGLLIDTNTGEIVAKKV